MNYEAFKTRLPVAVCIEKQQEKMKKRILNIPTARILCGRIRRFLDVDSSINDLLVHEFGTPRAFLTEILNFSG